MKRKLVQCVACYGHHVQGSKTHIKCLEKRVHELGCVLDEYRLGKDVNAMLGSKGYCECDQPDIIISNYEQVKSMIIPVGQTPSIDMVPMFKCIKCDGKPNWRTVDPMNTRPEVLEHLLDFAKRTTKLKGWDKNPSPPGTVKK